MLKNTSLAHKFHCLLLILLTICSVVSVVAGGIYVQRSQTNKGAQSLATMRAELMQRS